MRTKTEYLIAVAKKQLASTDYKILKHIEGKLPEDEYTAVVQHREMLREQIRALEGEK